ncbi:MAG: 3-phosphoshikimate 1-carboxyvinyltransferase [Acidimicrobiales bacterium]
MPIPDPLPIEPISGPLDATVALPGSKSLTNRALVCAALATGTSTLRHPLWADDTVAMVEGLQALGIDVEGDHEGGDWSGDELRITGCEGRPPAEVGIVDARLSGTTARFLIPVAALGSGHVRVDGALPLRARPMGPTVDALRSLRVTVTEVGEPGHLPVEVHGGPAAGGAVRVSAHASSQFLSGLLMAGPAMRTGLRIDVDGAVVSEPYVDMTVAVMAAFGASAVRADGGWSVDPQPYRAAEHVIEPDASAASYAFAAAALLGGSVRVEGLGTGSLQGDLAFVDVLERMGARVERTPTATTVHGTGILRGVEADLGDLSDTAQTLAVVAAFAEGPTRVTGVGFIRRKETDRIAAVVAELRRAGIEADEEPDGFVVRPGTTPRPATIQTYDDHRMAMAFALLGLRAPGIRIADPACVGKTFPGYWAMLDRLRRGHG